MLHKYCNLNRFEILEYTLPQIMSLLEEVNKHIKFEIECKVGAFGGSVRDEDGDDGEYKEITEDDVIALQSILG